MAPLASLRRRIVVGVSAAAILAIGALLKPAAPAVTPPSSETPAPMLQEVVQQREAHTIFRRMQDTWPRVARFTARVALMPSDQDLIEFGPVDPRRTAERFGVVVGTRRVLADIVDFPDGALVRVTLGDGRVFDARLAGAGADRPLAMIEAPAGIVLEPPFHATTIPAGTALFAAAPRADGSVIAPLFVAHASARELLTTNALDAFRGMAVFDLDGQLAGVLAHERGEVRLLTGAAALEPRPPTLPEPRAPLEQP